MLEGLTTTPLLLGETRRISFVNSLTNDELTS